MSKFTKFFGGTAVALTLMAGATQASAVVVTDWAYEVNSGFAAFGPQPAVTGSNPNPNAGGAPTVLSWGTGDDGPSQLVVTPTVTNPPTLITGGAAVPGASLTHFNRTIGAGPTLETATLVSSLVLTPLQPVPGGALDPIFVQFPIKFEETTNFPTGGESCVTGATPCADIFVLEDTGDLTSQFILDGIVYTVELLVAGIGPLTQAQCEAAGDVAGCVGFITTEGQENVLDTTFRITARAVPEPGTLALLGLGLLGLGVARRRKAAA